MFFLIKLLLLPLWLPFKIIAEIVEHSGHRRHYRRRRRLRVNWAPGGAGLSAWSSQIMQAAGNLGRPPWQRFALTALAALAVVMAWTVLVTAWLYWWMLAGIVVVLAAIF